jgi:hypothetical protein
MDVSIPPPPQQQLGGRAEYDTDAAVCASPSGAMVLDQTYPAPPLRSCVLTSTQGYKDRESVKVMREKSQDLLSRAAFRSFKKGQPLNEFVSGVRQACVGLGTLLCTCLLLPWCTLTLLRSGMGSVTHHAHCCIVTLKAADPPCCCAFTHAHTCLLTCPQSAARLILMFLQDREAMGRRGQVGGWAGGGGSGSAGEGAQSALSLKYLSVGSGISLPLEDGSIQYCGTRFTK